jgi:hypothetical protein
MKPQIIFIHGGDSFTTPEDFYESLRAMEFSFNAPPRIRWRDTLALKLASSHVYHFIQMPNAMNADYAAWSIWFDKVVPLLRDGAVLIGHSLGGSFLLRYLTVTDIGVTVSQLHLVAPVVDELDCPGMGNFSTDIETWPGFMSAVSDVHLWHSSDDDVVPIHHSERLAAKIPTATLHIFTDRGHFLQNEFPELEESITSVY